MILQIFTIIAPVIFIAALGYIWEKRKMPFDTNVISYLCSYIGAPCLMLNTLLHNKVDLSVVARIVLAAILLVIIMGAIGWALAKVLKLPPRVYAPALMFPNSGNMGMPLCLFAFGPTGLAFAVTFFATMAGLQFSVGASIASGKFALRGLFTNPVIIAIVFAGILMAMDATLPEWAFNILALLGNIMIPLMLLSLGTSLAKLQVASFGRSIGFSVLRLAGGLVVGMGIAYVLGLDGAARGSVIIQSTRPIAVFTYMFALRFDNRPEEVAAMVFISTILSFLTLPFLMAFVLSL